MSTTVKLSRPLYLIFHPEGEPWRVKVYGADGMEIATVTFDGSESESMKLAYEYFEFKTSGSNA